MFLGVAAVVAWLLSGESWPAKEIGGFLFSARMLFELVRALPSFRSTSDICECGRICKVVPRNASKLKCFTEAAVLAASSEKLKDNFSLRVARVHVSATVPPYEHSSGHMSHSYTDSSCILG